MEYTISGKIIDVINKKIFPGEILVKGRKIVKIRLTRKAQNVFIIPGLIDAHIHIESSMLVPSEFSRLAVRHGTIAAISDPHEIANVLGIEGINFMHLNGRKVPFKFYFGVPSCVPATKFETAGGKLDEKETEQLFLNYKFKYLAEVMNFPGVIAGDENMIAKIKIAKKYNKKIDGHAPGLTGENLKKYVAQGITTDHESTLIEEGREKISLGMNLLIREGSAAKNFNDLIPLIKEYPANIMLCTDDLHPDDLINGHINSLIKNGINKGYDLFDMLRAATLNPAMHYNLDTGLLRENDPADFVIIDDPDNFSIIATYIEGKKVYEKGVTKIKHVIAKDKNVFKCDKIKVGQLKVPARSNKIKVIEIVDGKLYTRELVKSATVKDGEIISDINNDILKIIVYNRYSKSIPAISFIKGFNLKKGAIASTIAHDSHNIIAVGIRDEDIAAAINRLIDIKGGILLTDGEKFEEIQLNIAGLLTSKNGIKVAKEYREMNNKVRLMGSTLRSPFMTMSFMALLVIPELKLSDRGLFDVRKFNFTDLYYREEE
jgi:adenine deaminase